MSSLKGILEWPLIYNHYLIPPIKGMYYVIGKISGVRAFRNYSVEVKNPAQEIESYIHNPRSQVCLLAFLFSPFPI